jgi:hypothetical protein
MENNEPVMDDFALLKINDDVQMRKSDEDIHQTLFCIVGFNRYSDKRKTKYLSAIQIRRRMIRQDG